MTRDPGQLALPIRLAVGASAAVCALSAAAGLVVGLVPSLAGVQQPLWMFAGFEVVVLVASVFGVLLALGTIRRGWAIAAACIAGAIGVSSILQLVISSNNQLGSVSLMPFAAGRLAVSVVVVAAACLMVLRTRQAWIRLGSGLVLAAPIAAIVVPIGARRVGIPLPDVASMLANTLGGIGPAASLMLTLLGGLLGIILVSASGHLLITAFDTEISDGNGAKPRPAGSE
ncbi:MAG: hypothetical protein ACTS22_05845 [Phycisphaerales bacterium]